MLEHVLLEAGPLGEGGAAHCALVQAGGCLVWGGEKGLKGGFAFKFYFIN